MSVSVTKSGFNVREKLKELQKPIGLKGSELMRAETAQEARNLVSAGRKNLIINGAMQVAQRGTSTTLTTGTYSLDRYYVQSNVGSGHTWAQVSDAPSESGLQYSGKITVGTGASPSGTDYGRIIYYVEGYDAQQTCFGSSNAKAVTLSFWTKSSVTGTFGGCIKMQFASPYPGFFFTYTINSANTWEYKQITIPAGTMSGGTMSSSNGIGFLLAFDLGEGPSRSDSAGYNNPSASGGTLGVTGATKILATSGATWYITGLQLEVGRNATEFEHRSYGEELALCQRYYAVLGTTAQPSPCPVFSRGSSTKVMGIDLPVPMRATPTVGTAGNVRILRGGSYVDSNSSMVINSVTPTIYLGGSMTRLSIWWNSNLTSVTNLANEVYGGFSGGMAFSAEL